ncbi:phage adaptor protein [Streptomyces himalayensis]|uniref:Uncharacterized protein n=1 Tax=Streptomyces himalayensis subsp. himalayensis TaxID=2756131 RepID=A0A7W0DUD8_9ACTN|nr:hypothetical protein [Streptomyces himalayensis]MBA2951442.1 hypothetical protein [Streptomyces himalayensis subsp. himalayensis]
MPTFDQLVKRVRQQLLGFTMSQESVSELSGAMTASATTFTCDTGTVTNLSRGLVEIDDELILVKAYDVQSGVVSVMGLTNGRGYEGTTAASHATNALVTSNPAFPRARIKEAINDAITALYPHLVVFATTEITYNSAQAEYELPSDCKDIWYVTARTVGPSKVAQPMPNWRYNPRARTADFASGKSIQLFDAVTPGQAVRIVYAKAPATLGANADDFATVTGFADRISDLVVWAACKRLAPALESARLQQQSVEATERAPLVAQTSATKVVSMYASLYAERLEEERALMFAELPNYATFQGS